MDLDSSISSGTGGGSSMMSTPPPSTPAPPPGTASSSPVYHHISPPFRMEGTPRPVPAIVSPSPHFPPPHTAAAAAAAHAPPGDDSKHMQQQQHRHRLTVGDGEDERSPGRPAYAHARRCSSNAQTPRSRTRNDNNTNRRTAAAYSPGATAATTHSSSPGRRHTRKRARPPPPPPALPPPATNEEEEAAHQPTNSTATTTTTMPENPKHLDGVADMAKLIYLEEHHIIKNIQHRYQHQNQIYTSISKVLVAVNPYQVLPALSGPHLMQLYRQRWMNKYGYAERRAAAAHAPPHLHPSIQVQQQQQQPGNQDEEDVDDDDDDDDVDALLRKAHQLIDISDSSGGVELHAESNDQRHSSRKRRDRKAAARATASSARYMGEGKGPGVAAGEELPPHPYQVAQMAYHALLSARNLAFSQILNPKQQRHRLTTTDGGERSTNQNEEYHSQGAQQILLVCGESGSGKTETAKMLMQYLAFLTSDGSLEEQLEGTPTNISQEQVHLVHSLENKVLKSNPVLEAFGNAKTVLNHNSSRFGKLTKMLFHGNDNNADGHGHVRGSGSGRDHMLRLHGARIETYLLENSRVVHQDLGERNYHIFYQMCSGAVVALPPRWREVCMMQNVSASDFRYLTHGRCVEIPTMHDGEQFNDVLDAMGVLGIGIEQKLCLFRVLSGILYLGNVRFMGEGDDGSSTSVDDANIEPSGTSKSALERCAALFGVSASDLLKRLETRTFTVKEKNIERRIAKRYSGRDAVRNRDSIAKQLYETLFSWIVQRVNEGLIFSNSSTASPINPKTNCITAGASRPVQQCIGILDVFGFEFFERNSLEQFCINFANEKLQRFFNYSIMEADQNEYNREGIIWKHVPLPDTQGCIDLIESRPNGIFALLDSACKVNGKPSDFVATVFDTFEGKNSFLKRVKAFSSRHVQFQYDTERSFAIRHYGGLVAYDASEFLLKNDGSSHPDTATLLLSSKTEFVRDLAESMGNSIATECVGVGRRRGGEISNVGSRSRSYSSVGTRPRRSSSVSGRDRYTGSEFAGQLQLLGRELDRSEPYFIRCISPNERMQAMSFDCGYVLKQLRCGGLIQALSVLKHGYPRRVPYKDVVDRFNDVVEVPDNVDVRDYCEALLMVCGQTSKEPSWILPNVNRGDYQLGITKLFLKSTIADFFEQLEDAFRICPPSRSIVSAIGSFLLQKRWKRVCGAVFVYTLMRGRIQGMRAGSRFRHAARVMVHISRSFPRRLGCLRMEKKRAEEARWLAEQEKLTLKRKSEASMKIARWIDLCNRRRKLKIELQRRAAVRANRIPRREYTTTEVKLLGTFGHQILTWMAKVQERAGANMAAVAPVSSNIMDALEDGLYLGATITAIDQAKEPVLNSMHQRPADTHHDAPRIVGGQLRAWYARVNLANCLKSMKGMGIDDSTFFAPNDIISPGKAGGVGRVINCLCHLARVAYHRYGIEPFPAIASAVEDGDRLRQFIEHVATSRRGSLDASATAAVVGPQGASYSMTLPDVFEVDKVISGVYGDASKTAHETNVDSPVEVDNNESGDDENSAKDSTLDDPDRRDIAMSNVYSPVDSIHITPVMSMSPTSAELRAVPWSNDVVALIGSDISSPLADQKAQGSTGGTEENAKGFSFGDVTLVGFEQVPPSTSAPATEYKRGRRHQPRKCSASASKVEKGNGRASDRRERRDSLESIDVDLTVLPTWATYGQGLPMSVTRTKLVGGMGSEFLPISSDSDSEDPQVDSDVDDSEIIRVPASLSRRGSTASPSHHRSYTVPESGYDLAAMKSPRFVGTGLLGEGGSLTKYSLEGHGRVKFFRMVKPAQLNWGRSKIALQARKNASNFTDSNKYIRFKDVIAIVKGKESVAFRHPISGKESAAAIVDPSLCFTVCTMSRTLALSAETTALRDEWVAVLVRKVIAAVKKQNIVDQLMRQHALHSPGTPRRVSQHEKFSGRGDEEAKFTMGTLHERRSSLGSESGPWNDDTSPMNHVKLLRAQLKGAEVRYSRVCKDNEQIREDLRAVRSDLDDATAAKSSMEEQRDSVCAQMEKASVEFEQRMVAVRENAEKERVASLAKVEAERAEIVAKAKDDRAALLAEQESKRVKLLEDMKRVEQVRIDTLKERMRVEVEAKAAHILDLQQQNEQMRRRQADELQRITTLLEEKDRSLQVHQNDLNKRQEQIDLLLTESRSLGEDAARAAAFKMQVEELSKQLSATKVERDALKLDRASLQRKNDSLRLEHDELRRTLEASHADAAVTREMSESVHETVKQMSLARDRILSEKERLEVEVKRLRRERDEANVERDEAKHHLLMQTDEHTRASAILKENIDTLGTQCDELRDSCGKAKSSLDSAVSDRDALKKLLEEKEGTIISLGQIHDELERTVALLREEVERLKIALHSSEALYAEVVKERNELRTTLEPEVHRLRFRVKELEARLVEQDALRSRMDVAERGADAIREEYKRLLADLPVVRERALVAERACMQAKHSLLLSNASRDAAQEEAVALQSSLDRLQKTRSEYDKEHAQSLASMSRRAQEAEARVAALSAKHATVQDAASAEHARLEVLAEERAREAEASVRALESERKRASVALDALERMHEEERAIWTAARAERHGLASDAQRERAAKRMAEEQVKWISNERDAYDDAVTVLVDIMDAEDIASGGDREALVSQSPAVPAHATPLWQLSERSRHQPVRQASPTKRKTVNSGWQHSPAPLQQVHQQRARPMPSASQSAKTRDIMWASVRSPDGADGAAAGDYGSGGSHESEWDHHEEEDQQSYFVTKEQLEEYKLNVPLQRTSIPNVYLFGSTRVYLVVMRRGSPMVRVGGGYVALHEFQQRHVTREALKLLHQDAVLAREQRDKGLLGVRAPLPLSTWLNAKERARQP